MTPKPTLVNPTNDQISAAVAEFVAGWTDIIAVRPNGQIATCYGKFLPGGAWLSVPPFATSADAVLPLLRRAGIIHAEICNGTVAIHIYVYNHDTEEPEMIGEGSSDPDSENEGSFALAASIALLRAHGVTFTFTNPTQEDKV